MHAKKAKQTVNKANAAKRANAAEAKKRQSEADAHDWEEELKVYHMQWSSGAATRPTVPETQESKAHDQHAA